MSLKLYENKTIKRVNILSGKYIKNIIYNLFILNGRTLKKVVKEENIIRFEIDDLLVLSVINSNSKWCNIKSEFSRICIDFKDGSKLYLNDKNNFATFKIKQGEKFENSNYR